MASLKDIAKLANVSVATVSNTLNNRGRVGDETRKKIFEIADQLDYRPNSIAKSLKLRKTRTIGVIVEDISVFNAPAIIDGINDYADKNDFLILLTNLRLFKKFGNEYPDIEQLKVLAQPAFNQLLGNQVAGIIYIGIHLRDITGLFPNSNKPIVFTYCNTTDENDHSVNYDDYSAAYIAAEYLIKKGHKKIGLISGMINSAPAHARFNGYYNALIDYNLNFDPKFIVTGDWQYESGYSMTMDLIQSGNVPTAIMAMNDLMAGGVIQAARESGYIIPKDLSVIGFDNRELSNYYTPGLTTILLPLHEMGIKSIEVLINLIHRKKVEPNKYKLQCKLLERASVHSL